MAHFPERDEVTPDRLIACLTKAKRAMTQREIAGELNLRHLGRRALTKIVNKMVHRGELERESRGRIILPAPGGRPAKKQPARSTQQSVTARPQRNQESFSEAGLIRGRLVAHRDGYGFVVPEKPIAKLDGDIFVPRNEMGDAMHGDTVLVKMMRREPDGRSSGRIARVVEHANATVVGLFRYGARENIVLPYESRLSEIVIPPGAELTPELAAKHKLTRPTSPRERIPQLDGAVVNVEDPEISSRWSHRHRTRHRNSRPPGRYRRRHRNHHSQAPASPRFSARSLGGSRESRMNPTQAPHRPRRFPRASHRHIDGETARDFDDAVYVERRGRHWHLQVHIADVAHYVRP